MQKEINIPAEIEIDGDLIFTTVKKYKLFLSKGKDGINAHSLYCHLMFTGRMQKTNQVWANDYYLKKGLGWGEKKLKKAKDLLLELGLIEIIEQEPDINNSGHFTKPYIKVITNTALSTSTGTPKKQERPQPVPENNDQMLKVKNKMLKVKNKILKVKNNIESADSLIFNSSIEIGKSKSSIKIKKYKPPQKNKRDIHPRPAPSQGRPENIEPFTWSVARNWNRAIKKLKLIGKPHNIVKFDLNQGATARLLDLQDKLNILTEGKADTHFNIKETYKKRNYLTEEFLRTKFTEKEIKHIIVNELPKLFVIGYEPENKKTIPKLLENIIFNGKSSKFARKKTRNSSIESGRSSYFLAIIRKGKVKNSSENKSTKEIKNEIDYSVEKSKGRIKETWEHFKARKLKEGYVLADLYTINSPTLADLSVEEMEKYEKEVDAYLRKLEEKNKKERKKYDLEISQYINSLENNKSNQVII